MKDFKRGGFNPRFNNKPRFSDRGGRNDGPKEMFPAKCSECGRSCEVPFRPNGEKPVFCNDCFNAQKESMSGNFAPKPRFDKKFDRGFDKRRFERNDRPQRDFGPTVRPVAPVDERNNRRIDELKATVAGLSAQMKEVLAIIGTKPVVTATPTPKAQEVAPVVKKVAKKVAQVAPKKATKKKSAAKKK